MVILPKSPYFVIQRPKTAKYCEKPCTYADLKIETWEYLSILLGLAKGSEKDKNGHFTQKSILYYSEAKMVKFEFYIKMCCHIVYSYTFA